jgi:hypothetical protein
MEENKSVNEITEAILNILKENQKKYFYDEENNFFSIPAVLNKKMDITICIIPQKFGYLVYSCSPIWADTYNSKVAEFICRANHSIIYGNFDFNFDFEPDRGNITFKTTTFCHTPPDKDLFMYDIYHHLRMCDRYSSGILNILSGKKTSPELEINRCEHPDQYPQEDDTEELEINTDIFKNNIE